MSSFETADHVELPPRIGGYTVGAPLAPGPYGIRHAAADGEGCESVLVVTARVDAAPDAVLARVEGALRRRGELDTVVFPKVLACGNLEGRIWFVHPPIAGRPLADWAADVPSANATRIAAVGARIAEGLAKAHAAGLLHRDLALDRILVTDDDVPTVIGLGLVADAMAPSVLPGEGVFGALPFKAPEQGRGEDADPGTDVFGLGATLFAACAGRAPRDDGPRLTVLESVRSRSAASLPGSVPERLRTVILRAMSFRSSRRHASAEAMAEELAAFAAGRPAPEWVANAPQPGVVDRLQRNHGRFVAFSAIALIVVFVWLHASSSGPQDTAHARGLRHDAALAWAEGDADAMRSIGRELAELDGRDGAIGRLLAMETTDTVPDVEDQDPVVRGLASWRSGRAADAQRLLARAKGELAAVGAGRCALTHCAPTDAVDAIRTLVSKRPKSQALRRLLVVALAADGRHREAANALAGLADERPHRLRWRVRLAGLLEAAGRPDDALREYRRVLKSDLAHAQAAAAVRRLDPAAPGR